jgi:2-hydroxy-3-oxopropionate reductase
MEVGFVGLGIMGRPMALNLLKGGHALLLFSRSGVAHELTSAGGRACASAREVAERTEVVFTMVPDTADVERAVFGPGGVAEGLAPGKVVVDMSSISPIETRRFAERVRALGADWLDAPVSGGDVGARAATLTIMAGGREATFERVRPLLTLLGKNVTLVGESGAGQTCKVSNQIVVALTIEAVAEALLFASKSGVDPAKVRQALLGGFASSRVLEVHGERMLTRSFAPGARVALHQKDLGNALAGARALGLSLPGTAAAQELFNACVAMGGAGWDHSALVRALEKLAAHELPGAAAKP